MYIVLSTVIQQRSVPDRYQHGARIDKAEIDKVGINRERYIRTLDLKVQTVHLLTGADASSMKRHYETALKLYIHNCT